MVSTRGVKIKFSEGERVLCYEPDPTKAKVLYDSKVLQIVHNKDGKGRKQVEYLIHFQNARNSSSKNATFCKGWNASWDRRVTEDYVLRDTEENRELQKQLAEKAHIKLSIKSNRVLLGSGSYSKERKRKRRLSETIRETIERERKNREGSDTSSQTGTGTTEDDIESISSSGMGSSTTNTNIDQDDDDDDEEEDVSDDDSISSHIPVVIPETLKGVIEKDFFFINEKSKLLNLPSKKCALSVLEDYVKFFAFRYLSRTREKRRSEPKDKENSIMTLDLCKEVVDGFRVCFDFYVHSLLLYPRERQQAERLKKALPIKTEQFDGDSSLLSVGEDLLETKGNARLAPKEKEEKKEATPRRILRSKRPHSEDMMLVELKDTPRSQAPQQQLQAQPQSSALSCESGRSTPTTLTSGVSGTDGNTSFPLGDGKGSFPQQFKELNNWTLLPEQYRNPAPPILLYGPHHLLRLFVKMPEIMYRMNLPGERKKIVLHHIDLFLEYLTMHVNDLFAESNYVNYIEC